MKTNNEMTNELNGEETVESKKDEKKRKKKEKRMDLAAKILCAFFAVLLWFYVMIVESPADEMVIRDVEIQIPADDRDLLSKGLSVYAGSGETMDVTLSGKRKILSRITAEDIVITADLSSLTSAGTDISVPLRIKVPDGCELVSAEKYSISLSVDSMKKALIPLRAEYIGMNPDYIYAENPVFSRVDEGREVKYNAVIVEGPASVVKNVDSAVVMIDVSGKNMDFREEHSIQLVDADGLSVSHEFLKTEFQSINANVTIRMEVTVPLTVDFVRGYFDSTNTGVLLNPSEVTVLCSPTDAERSDLLQPLEIDEDLILTEEGMSSRYFETVCYPVSPYGTVSPSDVNVEITLDESIYNRRMTINQLNSTNGLKVSCNILNSSIENVMVCGRAEVLGTLNPSDITAIVDLSDYKTANIGKRYRKKVVFEVDSEYKDEIFFVGEYMVEIEITEK